MKDKQKKQMEKVMEITDKLLNGELNILYAQAAINDENGKFDDINDIRMEYIIRLWETLKSIIRTELRIH